MPGIAIAIAIGFSNNYPTFEQPRQACSQVFLRRGAIQRADGPNEAEAKGQVSRGGGEGELWLSETELRSKFAIGRLTR